DSLAIARVPQANRIGWVAKRRALVARAAPKVISVKAPGKRATVERLKTSAQSKKKPGRSSKG
ncbi:MAG: hypothetical protein KF682_20515, partial [Nitrospira sp.]|nr:hypothetical protein [Nitrospira sp.]